MNEILNKLADWKEKILFGIVVIACGFVAMNARPLGGGIADIDEAEIDAAIKRSGIDPKQATNTLELLKHPPEAKSIEVDAKLLDQPFFSKDNSYSAPKGSAWQLAQQEYKTLPPLEMSSPGFTTMPDFDLPAGPTPALRALRGYVPRDTRTVSLADISRSEFTD